MLSQRVNELLTIEERNSTKQPKKKNSLCLDSILFN